MELDELQNRILNMQEFERMESRPSVAYDPSEGMSEAQCRKFILFLYEKLTALQRSFDELSETNKQQAKSLDRSYRMTETLNEQIKSLTRLNKKLVDELSLLRADYFGSSKSRKGLRKKAEVIGKNDARSDFDGTEESLKRAGDKDSQKKDENGDSNETPSMTGTSSSTESSNTQQFNRPYHGPSRLGTTYNKQTVGEPIVHAFDKESLPEGTKILKVLKPKVVRNLVSYIEEHHFERLKVLLPSGEEKVVVCPKDAMGKRLLEEVVPGTHITATLLSNMIFNRYQMCCPDYRESKNRWTEMSWNTCRQNLANWADKGAICLNLLIPALKAQALKGGANVNVDETWCRYQTHFGHKKTYMWCLVNRKAHIVIFFYEDCVDEYGRKHEGGRRRSVLKEFLGDADIKSLQSDGYNVYMYLDDELMEVDHLCCLAHAHNKLKDALSCGSELAYSFIQDIGKLYHFEKVYQKLHLTPDQITVERNKKETNDIIDSMRLRMLEALVKPDKLSDQMLKALNYLHKFWDQLFLYQKDGNYTIDNLAAERAIRPMTVQRKNSLFFGSTNGALRSAVYNTFIETCKSLGVSFRQYFTRLIIEIKKGRTDYENLLPMTLSLK